MYVELCFTGRGSLSVLPVKTVTNLEKNRKKLTMKEHQSEDFGDALT